MTLATTEEHTEYLSMLSMETSSFTKTIDGGVRGPNSTSLNIVKRLVESSGTGCSRALISSSLIPNSNLKQKQLLTRSNMDWISKMNKGESYCIIEIKSKLLRRYKDFPGRTIRISIGPCNTGCPNRVSISTSKHPIQNYKIVHSDWYLGNHTGLQSIDLLDSSIQNYIKIQFDGTIDGTNTHRIAKLLLTLEVENRDLGSEIEDVEVDKSLALQEPEGGDLSDRNRTFNRSHGKSLVRNDSLLGSNRSPNEDVKLNGYTKGKSQGSFSPEQSRSRSEAGSVTGLSIDRSIGRSAAISITNSRPQSAVHSISSQLQRDNQSQHASHISEHSAFSKDHLANDIRSESIDNSITYSVKDNRSDNGSITQRSTYNITRPISPSAMSNERSSDAVLRDGKSEHGDMLSVLSQNTHRSERSNRSHHSALSRHTEQSKHSRHSLATEKSHHSHHSAISHHTNISEQSQHTKKSIHSQHTQQSQLSHHTQHSQQSQRSHATERSHHTQRSVQSQHTYHSELSHHTEASEKSHHTQHSMHSHRTQQSAISHHTQHSTPSHYSHNTQKSSYTTQSLPSHSMLSKFSQLIQEGDESASVSHSSYRSNGQPISSGEYALATNHQSEILLDTNIIDERSNYKDELPHNLEDQYPNNDDYTSSQNELDNSDEVEIKEIDGDMTSENAYIQPEAMPTISSSKDIYNEPIPSNRNAKEIEAINEIYQDGVEHNSDSHSVFSSKYNSLKSLDQGIDKWETGASIGHDMISVDWNESQNGDRESTHNEEDQSVSCQSRHSRQSTAHSERSNASSRGINTSVYAIPKTTAGLSPEHATILGRTLHLKKRGYPQVFIAHQHNSLSSLSLEKFILKSLSEGTFRNFLTEKASSFIYEDIVISPVPTDTTNDESSTEPTQYPSKSHQPCTPAQSPSTNKPMNVDSSSKLEADIRLAALQHILETRKLREKEGTELTRLHESLNDSITSVDVFQVLNNSTRSQSKKGKLNDSHRKQKALLEVFNTSIHIDDEVPKEKSFQVTVRNQNSPSNTLSHIVKEPHAFGVIDEHKPPQMFSPNEKVTVAVEPKNSSGKFASFVRIPHYDGDEDIVLPSEGVEKKSVLEQMKEKLREQQELQRKLQLLKQQSQLETPKRPTMEEITQILIDKMTMKKVSTAPKDVSNASLPERHVPNRAAPSPPHLTHATEHVIPVFLNNSPEYPQYAQSGVNSITSSFKTVHETTKHVHPSHAENLVQENSYNKPIILDDHENHSSIHRQEMKSKANIENGTARSKISMPQIVEEPQQVSADRKTLSTKLSAKDDLATLTSSNRSQVQSNQNSQLKNESPKNPSQNSQPHSESQLQTSNNDDVSSESSLEIEEDAIMEEEKHIIQSVPQMEEMTFNTDTKEQKEVPETTLPQLSSQESVGSTEPTKIATIDTTDSVSLKSSHSKKSTRSRDSSKLSTTTELVANPNLKDESVASKSEAPYDESKSLTIEEVAIVADAPPLRDDLSVQSTNSNKTATSNRSHQTSKSTKSVNERLTDEIPTVRSIKSEKSNKSEKSFKSDSSTQSEKEMENIKSARSSKISTNSQSDDQYVEACIESARSVTSEKSSSSQTVEEKSSDASNIQSLHEEIQQKEVEMLTIEVEAEPHNIHEEHDESEDQEKIDASDLSINEYPASEVSLRINTTTKAYIHSELTRFGGRGDDDSVVNNSSDVSSIMQEEEESNDFETVSREDETSRDDEQSEITSHEVTKKEHNLLHLESVEVPPLRKELDSSHPPFITEFVPPFVIGAKKVELPLNNPIVENKLEPSLQGDFIEDSLVQQSKISEAEISIASDILEIASHEMDVTAIQEKLNEIEQQNNLQNDEDLTIVEKVCAPSEIAEKDEDPGFSEEEIRSDEMKEHLSELVQLIDEDIDSPQDNRLPQDATTTENIQPDHLTASEKITQAIEEPSEEVHGLAPAGESLQPLEDIAATTADLQPEHHYTPEKIAQAKFINESRMKRMKKGTLIKKFNKKKKKTTKRTMKLDKDKKTLIISHKGLLKRTTKLPLKDVKWLVYGPHSNIFKRSSIKYPWRCFTLVTSERSLDFEAENDKDADMWILGIQSLIVDSIVANGRLLHTKTGLTMKRISYRLQAKRANTRFKDIVLQAVNTSHSSLNSSRSSLNISQELQMNTSQTQSNVESNVEESSLLDQFVHETVKSQIEPDSIVSPEVNENGLPVSEYSEEAENDKLTLESTLKEYIQRDGEISVVSDLTEVSLEDAASELKEDSAKIFQIE